MSADSFLLEVVTPAAKVFSGTVSEVRAPGFEGEFGVLPGHADYVTAMRPGPLTFQHEGQSRRLLVGAGFAEVGTDKVVLLTDLCEEVDGIDPEAAAGSMRADERVMLEHNPSDHEYLDAKADQALQIARIQAADPRD
ncbi:MAG: ATP synthase F1 subunit epsilon [Myxococcota bacterium]|jgi:F-type H+-transporting ATPase subunit epsilon|nr:ATP synthase F1 subunit epsilon [Myxococcota bacterium]